MRAVLSVLLFSSVVLTSAAAQETTGDIQGRVVGPTGQPLPDVQVSVTSPSLQGDRQTASDARGHFVLPSLPAGSYTVTIRRIGFRLIRVEDLPVRLGSTTSLGEVSLQVQAVDVAEVVVSGSRPVIDPVSPASGMTLDSSQFLSLPSNRDFRALIGFVSQANPSSYSNPNPYLAEGVNISGSSGSDNAFYVDGMNVTVLTGNSVDLPFNFVRDIQVATGGYSAEYGRALSGVINVVTPSGGNVFHGQALGFFTADELRSAPRVGSGAADAVNFGQYDVGLSLSGPLRHDRLWFFAAYNPTFATQDVVLAAIPKQRETQTHHLFAGKVTWRAETRTELSLTLLGDPYVRNSASDFLDVYLPSTTEPSTVLSRETGGGTTVALRVSHQFDTRTQVTAAVSRLDRHVFQDPRVGSTGLQAITRLDDYTTNAATGGIGGFDDSRESRTALRIGVTRLGNGHAVKLGVEYEDNAYSDSGTISIISRTADSVYDWSVNPGFSHVHNLVPTAYIQDAWQVGPRLLISAGLRWEAQHMSGQVGPRRTIASEVAPRLGLVYEPGELGSQRLFASAGRFFEQVAPVAMIFWNATGVATTERFPQNPLVDSRNGVVLSRTDFGTIPATGDLKGQYYDQVSLGYERRVLAVYKVRVQGTYRLLRSVLEDGNIITPGDTVYRMGNPGRGPLASLPQARQRYGALELSLERSTPGPLYLLSSYVLSRNVGNYTGLYASDLQFALPNSGPQFDWPDLLVNAYGLLPNDRTHVGKAAASYRFGFGTTIGGFLTVSSGTPLSEYGVAAAGNPYRTFLRPRGSAGRTPTIWSLDLHAAYDLRVAPEARVRPKILLDVFNVGSPRRALLYDQLHYLDDTKTVNPNYRAVARYQPPMSARVAVIVDF